MARWKHWADSQPTHLGSYIAEAKLYARYDSGDGCVQPESMFSLLSDWLELTRPDDEPGQRMTLLRQVVSRFPTFDKAVPILDVIQLYTGTLRKLVETWKAEAVEDAEREMEAEIERVNSEAKARAINNQWPAFCPNDPADCARLDAIYEQECVPARTLKVKGNAAYKRNDYALALRYYRAALACFTEPNCTAGVYDRQLFALKVGCLPVSALPFRMQVRVEVSARVVGSVLRMNHPSGCSTPNKRITPFPHRLMAGCCFPHLRCGWQQRGQYQRHFCARARALAQRDANIPACRQY